MPGKGIGGHGVGVDDGRCGISEATGHLWRHHEQGLQKGKTGRRDSLQKRTRAKGIYPSAPDTPYGRHLCDARSQQEDADDS